MLDRKATATVLTLAAFGFGGGIAFAATHGSSHAVAQHAKQTARIRAPKLVKGLVSVHVCHPGQAGSRLDALN
jgi:hypothetical protein